VIVGYDKEKANRNFGGAFMVKFAGGGFSKLPHFNLLPNQIISKQVNIAPWDESKNSKLITDPVKKQEVKEAISDYVRERQLSIVETVPILQAHNGKDHRYFTSFEEFKEKANPT